MTSLSESTIKRQIMRFLKSLPESDWEVSSPGSESGKPDITGCLRGRYVAIEVKREFYGPTRLQEYKIQKLKTAGALAGVAHSVSEAKKILRDNLLSWIEGQLHGNIDCPKCRHRTRDIFWSPGTSVSLKCIQCNTMIDLDDYLNKYNRDPHQR